MDGQDPSYAGSGPYDRSRGTAPARCGGRRGRDDRPVARETAELGGVDSRVVGVGRRPGATGRPADAGILRRVAIADIAIAPRPPVRQPRLARPPGAVDRRRGPVRADHRPRREAGRKPFELVAGEPPAGRLQGAGPGRDRRAGPRAGRPDGRDGGGDGEPLVHAAEAHAIRGRPVRWEALYQLRYPETMQHRAGGVALARKRGGEAGGLQRDGRSRRGSGRGLGAGGLVRGHRRRSAPGLEADGPAGPEAEPSLQRRYRETFEQCGVTSVQQDAIAAIKDPERRARCVWDIGQGLDPAEHVVRHAEPGGGRRSAGKSKDPEAGLADQEWLAHYCGRLRARLSDPGAYESDAILYRKVDKPRREFAAEAARLLDRAVSPWGGHFGRLVWQIVNVTHPEKVAPLQHLLGDRDRTRSAAVPQVPRVRVPPEIRAARLSHPGAARHVGRLRSPRAPCRPAGPPVRWPDHSSSRLSGPHCLAPRRQG